jgi:hypothetical protein
LRALDAGRTIACRPLGPYSAKQTDRYHCGGADDLHAPVPRHATDRCDRRGSLFLTPQPSLLPLHLPETSFKPRERASHVAMGLRSAQQSQRFSVPCSREEALSPNDDFSRAGVALPQGLALAFCRFRRLLRPLAGGQRFERALALANQGGDA